MSKLAFETYYVNCFLFDHLVNKKITETPIINFQLSALGIGKLP